MRFAKYQDVRLQIFIWGRADIQQTGRFRFFLLTVPVTKSRPLGIPKFPVVNRSLHITNGNMTLNNN